MAQFTDFLNLRFPEEGIDFMRASLDIQAAYELIDTFAEKIANPIRGKMTSVSAGIRTSGSLFKVPFDAVAYDHGGAVNLANSRFTIPTDDVYIISGQITWISATAGTPRKAHILVNGNTVKTDVVNEPTVTGEGLATNTLYYETEFHAGDQVEMWARHDNGSPLNPAFESSFGVRTWMTLRRGSFNV